jgi:glutamine amidotransferase-like uncharacterized protein
MKKSFCLLAAAALVTTISTPSLFAEDAKPIRVALFDDAGSAGKGVPKVKEQLGKAGDMQVTIVKGPDIAAGVLTNYDVVIFTGGSGSKQAASLGEGGREEVRKFVKSGGGYVGICAGAYLACSGFSWGVGVLDARTVSDKWMRGTGNVEIEVTEKGKTITDLSTNKQEIKYANGPIIKPNGRDDIPDYEPIAFFRTELAKNGTPKGVMVDSPAMARGEFGKGRVIISSPHPEQTAGMEGFSEHAVRWAAGRTKP